MHTKPFMIRTSSSSSTISSTSTSTLTSPLHSPSLNSPRSISQLYGSTNSFSNHKVTGRLFSEDATKQVKVTSLACAFGSDFSFCESCGVDVSIFSHESHCSES